MQGTSALALLNETPVLQASGVFTFRGHVNVLEVCELFHMVKKKVLIQWGPEIKYGPYLFQNQLKVSSMDYWMDDHDSGTISSCMRET